MRTPHHLSDRTEQRLATLMAWLLPVLAWLAHVAGRIGVVRRSARMRRTLLLCERLTARVLVLNAARMLGRRVRMCHAPRLAPPGFRLRIGDANRLHRFARVRARRRSVHERIALLRDVLRAPDAIARRMARGFAKGWRRVRLVLSAPAPALFQSAPTLAPDADDSS